MINLHKQRRLFEAKIGPDKALCYVQPILQVGATVGTASFNEIRIAANALLSQCATGQGQGGIATDIGMSFITSQNPLDESNNRVVVVQATGHSSSTGGNGNLALILGTYSPNIQCYGTLHKWPSCREIMNVMDVTSTNVIFGPRLDPRTQISLPDTLSSSKLPSVAYLWTLLLLPNAECAGDNKCFATIGGNLDSSTWYRMWEALTALYAVCGRHIQGGKFKGLGKCTMSL